jgi:hypothetical protein
MKTWKHNPVIYEINTWVWLQELQEHAQKALTLAEVPEKAWDAIATFHPDAVWLMGVWERSSAGIAISNQHAGNLEDFHRTLDDFILSDNVGSPYCIKGYNVDSFFGGAAGLAAARRKLAERGIKLLLDFVPNHLAHDHPWVSSHPEYFIQGEIDDIRRDPVTFVRIGNEIFACGKDPFYPAWQDVLQVNAFNSGLRNAVKDTLLDVATQCDGVRCDMAMLEMNQIFHQTWGHLAGQCPEYDYWPEIIPAIKQAHPSFLFIAEAYWDKEWDLQQQGFDFCYDKRLYDRLEGSDAKSVQSHLEAEMAFQQKLLRFIENHDEQRAVSVFQEQKEFAAALAFSTVPGAKLFHEGQFEGRLVRLPVFLRRRPEEPVNENVKTFYLKLLDVLQQPVFQEGEWALCRCSGWPDNQSFTNLLAWTWTCVSERILIIINFSALPSQGLVNLQGLESNAAIDFRDQWTGEIFRRNAAEIGNAGLYAALPPWGFHFFSYAEKRTFV